MAELKKVALRVQRAAYNWHHLMEREVESDSDGEEEEARPEEDEPNFWGLHESASLLWQHMDDEVDVLKEDLQMMLTFGQEVLHDWQKWMHLPRVQRRVSPVKRLQIQEELEQFVGLLAAVV